jgi:hypothetical protein
LPSNQGEVHSGEGYIDNIIDGMELQGYDILDYSENGHYKGVY